MPSGVCIAKELSSSERSGIQSQSVHAARMLTNVSTLVAAGVPSGVAHLALERNRLWANGHTITVKFLNGTAAMHDRVRRFARIWLEHANLHFNFVSSGTPAEVRVSFNSNDGNWSQIGTDCLADYHKQWSPTMNLEGRELQNDGVPIKRRELGTISRSTLDDIFIHHRSVPTLMLPKILIYLFCVPSDSCSGTLMLMDTSKSMPELVKKPYGPPTVPTDLTIPFNYWDSLPFARDICLDVTLRFDDVLDSEKFRSSLARLLEIGDWRKLGARLRQNAAGKLEYHVPATFDEKRPGFIYTTNEHDMIIADHPVGSRLPTAAATPFVVEGTAELRLCSPETPDSLEGRLDSDLPQLAIHLITFRDATLLTVTFQHTLMDAMGFDQDPLAPLTEQASPVPYILADRVLKGVRFFGFVFHLVFDHLWYRKESGRIIFIPGEHVDRMREEALTSLAGQATDSTKPFLSEGDILISWVTRAVLAGIKITSSRTVIILNVFSSRDILAELGHLPSKGAALIANAVFPSYTLLSAREILEKPLGFVASRVRRSLEQQRTKEQVPALAVLLKKAMDQSGRLSLFGDSSSQLIAWTNWHKAKLFQVDFSPAVVKPGIDLAKRATPLGRPSYINPMGTSRGMPFRNTGVVLGKDHAGNWWLGFFLRDGAWARFEQQLESTWKTDPSIQQ